jgi:hypothetical protein
MECIFGFENSSEIVPYVKGISKKLRCFGNHFNLRTKPKESEI